MFGFRMDGYWCDIGDVGSYIKAHRDVFRLGGILDLDLKKSQNFKGIQHFTKRKDKPKCVYWK